ncbi:MAG: hypothetical protein ACUVWO_06900 [Thermodesulfobacteriota bacterium]
MIKRITVISVTGIIISLFLVELFAHYLCSRGPTPSSAVGTSNLNR